ncbi:ComEC/Rec2 family competence protein [Galbibacter sp.]|uniref:ComEC/Rec2 family competence protein n=1 Tax=Galbibacter sp. TaxID=2918471 RepID=UPI003A8D4F2C
MVNIIFKNVGQGDSIIIEWKEGLNNKIGIIDCNQVTSTLNPVLQHVIKSKTKEIEFLFLSHPHKDHYSGFMELIEYCLSNQINIKRFIHTANVSIDYLMAASRSIIEKKELSKLYELLMDMRDRGLIELHTVDDNPDTVKNLSEGFKLAFLAPSSQEIDKYIRGVAFPFDEEDSTSNPNANWLCSIIKIYNDNTSIILSSDVESQVLKRLNKKNGRLKEQKSILVQVPHHGAKKNMNKSFWSGLRKYPETYAVISVGKNGYKHPSKEVIEFFTNHPNYILERTDLNAQTSQLAMANSAKLNIISKKVAISPTNQINNDLSYQVSDENCIKI